MTWRGVPHISSVRRQLWVDRSTSYDCFKEEGGLSAHPQKTRCVYNRQRYDPRAALIARAVLRWLVYTEIGAGWIEARKKEIPIQHGRRTGAIGCVENVARHRKKD